MAVSPSVVLANSPPKKEAEKEAKPEGKGEGKEGKEGEGEAKEPVNAAQKKQADEATELQTKVQALQAKVRTKDETIRKLIEEKNHTQDSAKVKEIIEQMVVEHKEMNKLIQEYEQNRSLLRYRYPEKGFHGTRNYERMEAKPLDQMENQMSIEAKLNQTRKTVEAQYGVVPKDPKKKSKKDSKPSAPSLTEPIVIQK
jgi:hypothetical protein